MTVEIREIFNGRVETLDEDSPSAEVIYDVIGVVDEDQVQSEIISGVSLVYSLPEPYGELTKRKIEIGERRTPDTWRVKVTYERAASTALTVLPSFDVTTSSTHVDMSIMTVGAFGPKADGTKLNKSNPIDTDGSTIRGADVLSSVYTKKVTQTFPAGFVTQEYEAQLVRFINCVNSKVFKGFAAGTVLFNGASGAMKDTGEYEIVFSFAIKPPLPAGGLMVGDILVGFYGIAGPIGAALAYDVVWPEYATRMVGTKLTKVPVAVYVDRIYNLADLNLLGLGDLW